MIELHLRTRILADPTVKARCENRVYPVGGPFEPRYPYIVYAREATTRTQSHDGDAGLTESRTLLVVVATDYAEAWTVADAIRKCCDGMRGDMGGIEVQRVQCLNDKDTGLPPQSADEAWRYTVSFHAIINWRETAPFV